jgi:hypothetical protein
MDPSEIATRTHRRRVVLRKMVERFGSNRPAHQATSSKAPWQLKPAPNADIHHQPPGA